MVLEAFDDAYNAATDWLDSGALNFDFEDSQKLFTAQEQAAAGWLREHVAGCPTADEALTRLRGAQAAFFWADVGIAVDSPKLIATHSATLTPLTPQLLPRLAPYVMPRHPAGVVLALATGLPPSALDQLRLRDIDDDGRTVRFNDRSWTIPGFAARSYARSCCRAGRSAPTTTIRCSRRFRAQTRRPESGRSS